MASFQFFILINGFIKNVVLRWQFKDIINNWEHTNYEKNQKK